MSIATSLDKLSETLTNCKTNLKEKKVENVDNIKISDVDEKIAEIQAGGSVKSPFEITSVKWGDYTELTNGGDVIVNEWKNSVNIDLNYTGEFPHAVLFFLLRDGSGMNTISSQNL